MYTWQSTSIGRNVIEKKFEIAHDDELTDPATLHGTHFWHFDIAFVCCANATRWINAQRSFGLIGWHRTYGGYALTANGMTREATQFADNALTRQTNHKRCAMIAFRRAAECSHQKLMHLLFLHHGTVHTVLILHARKRRKLQLKKNERRIQ